MLPKIYQTSTQTSLCFIVENVYSRLHFIGYSLWSAASEQTIVPASLCSSCPQGIVWQQDPRPGEVVDCAWSKVWAACSGSVLSVG